MLTSERTYTSCVNQSLFFCMCVSSSTDLLLETDCAINPPPALASHIHTLRKEIGSKSRRSKLGKRKKKRRATIPFSYSSIWLTFWSSSPLFLPFFCFSLPVVGRERSEKGTGARCHVPHSDRRYHHVEREASNISHHHHPATQGEPPPPPPERPWTLPSGPDDVHLGWWIVWY